MNIQSQTLNFAVSHRNVLTAEEAELYELSQLAGVVFDPQVFKIVLDLLRLNVAPTAVDRMLKTMTNPSVKKARPTKTNTENVPPVSSRGHQPSATGIKRPERR